MGELASDPVKITEFPNLTRLTLNFDRPAAIGDASLLVYLSREPLTNEAGALNSEWGYVRQSVFDSVLMFSEIVADQAEFTYTYLHSGEYYLTVVADMDGDRIPGDKDLFSPRLRIRIEPGSHPTFTIDQFIR